MVAVASGPEILTSVRKNENERKLLAFWSCFSLALPEGTNISSLCPIVTQTYGPGKGSIESYTSQELEKLIGIN